MKLILSNFQTECDPRELEVPGNPLLTYEQFRAGAGVPDRPEGNTETVLFYSADKDRWILDEDGSEWTDVEVVEL